MSQTTRTLPFAHGGWGGVFFVSPLFYFISPVSKRLQELESEKQIEGHWRRSVWSVDEFWPQSCILSPRSSSLFPIQPLLSAQWKSLITGGESNPWHWMKDEAPPLLFLTVSFSLHFSMDDGYAWQLFSTSLFLSLISLLPPSSSLSLVFIPLFPLFCPSYFTSRLR